MFLLLITTRRGSVEELVPPLLEKCLKAWGLVPNPALPTWLVLTRLELGSVLWLAALFNFVVRAPNSWSTDLRLREWYLMDHQLIKLQPRFPALSGESSSSPQTSMPAHTPLPYSFLPGIVEGQVQYRAHKCWSQCWELISDKVLHGFVFRDSFFVYFIVPWEMIPFLTSWPVVNRETRFEPWSSNIYWCARINGNIIVLTFIINYPLKKLPRRIVQQIKICIAGTVKPSSS